VPELYPTVEPYEAGMLDVGEGHRVFWEVCGKRDGEPAVVLHGGPGSGISPGFRRLFDPDAYRVLLFDQRGCGRSTPHASDPSVDLATNTTQHLLRDIERLREHFGLERWMVLGASWGSTLGLAYAESHPDRVTALLLGMVVTTTRREVEWVTRDVGRLFPAAWRRFRDGVPEADRDGSLVEAYSRLLHSPDPAVRDQAARDWCSWEDSHVAVRPNHRPDPRFDDPRFRMCFARLVTHYWRHGAFLNEGQLLSGAGSLAEIPGVLVHGRLDVSSPLDVAWALHQVWPNSELVVVEGADHHLDHGLDNALVAATDRFAAHNV
jgi:proline iminopeptidase